MKFRKSAAKTLRLPFLPNKWKNSVSRRDNRRLNCAFQRNNPNWQCRSTLLYLEFLIYWIKENILALVICMALTFPVCRTWGPRHKSMSGPHLYTVVVGVVTRSFMILCLNLLYWNKTMFDSSQIATHHCTRQFLTKHLKEITVPQTFSKDLPSSFLTSQRVVYPSEFFSLLDQDSESPLEPLICRQSTYRNRNRFQ